MHKSVNLSPIQIFFRNKWVRFAIVFNIILILVLIGVLIWQATKVSTISLDITPLDSTITINDTKYQNGQSSITPGTYEITISHNNLETKKLTVDIAPEHLVSISTFLSDSDKTFDYYKQRAHYSDYQKLEEIASAESNITTDHDTSAEEFIKHFQKNYTDFTTKLPIEYRETEGYGADRSTSKNITLKADYDCNLTLCIQALMVGTNDQTFINSLLTDKGINTEDFEIDYKVY